LKICFFAAGTKFNLSWIRSWLDRYDPKCNPPHIIRTCIIALFECEYPLAYGVEFEWQRTNTKKNSDLYCLITSSHTIDLQINAPPRLHPQTWCPQELHLLGVSED
jgi:hypothetical protein